MPAGVTLSPFRQILQGIKHLGVVKKIRATRVLKTEIVDQDQWVIEAWSEGHLWPAGARPQGLV
jgi:hypothetical protein